MRRSIVATVVAAGLTLSVLAATPPTSAEGRNGASLPRPTATRADAALATARAALSDTTPLARRTGRPQATPDATLALRDLFATLPRLDTDGRRAAHGLLARPTDGASDPQGDGYLVPARKRCHNHFCIHWVTTTADAPPSQAWVDANLSFMNKVWRTEVRKLGYRRPLSDGHRGGNAKFDVYLKELGSKGLYGYCAPERRSREHKWLASGYCVLDNDFARLQYGAPPRESLRVTAAHEFFHAVQFAYDYGEDPWLMEATAVWMEERVADDVNDNRQYLPYGQVGAPGQPLDTFRQGGFNQYGNWPFFEYLSQRFGNGVVRAIWTRAGAYPGAGHQYSTTAVKGVLEKHGGFVNVYRSFATGNTLPGSTYQEGRRWRAAPPARSWTLSRAHPSDRGTLRINHMASRTVRLRPGDGVVGRPWRLRVVVDGPDGKTDPAAYLLVRREHGLDRLPIRLDSAGRGQLTVHFGSRKVRAATVTLVNASTRFSCWHRTSWSCQGRARDNRMPFELRAVVRKGP